MKTISSTIYLTFALLAFACCAFLATAQAVVPPPDGGYPNFTTAEGQKALFSLTTGFANTAVGWYSLSSNTAGSFNTATGTGTLLFNTADENTAFGAATLLFNTTGAQNTAVGVAALLNNTNGGTNTAIGEGVLRSNTEGDANTASGFFALLSNTTGSNNTAIGLLALGSHSSGNSNTAIGWNALPSDSTGFSNVALGAAAGANVMTAHDVICIGTNVIGEDISNSCYIGSIFGQLSSSGSAVFINSSGKLGTTTSSRRFKEEIKPMVGSSEMLFELKPVTFHYKKEIDPAGTPQFGLVAEEVEKVNPDLVVRDKEGKPYSVRYEQVNAMLLNEFLKEHRKVEEQQATITQLKSAVAQQEKNFQATAAQQQQQIEALTTGLQKVNAQFEATKPAPRVVNNP